MANEIALTLRFAAKNTTANLDVSRIFDTLNFDMTGSKFDSGRQSIGTSAHAKIAMPNVGTPGFAIVRNTDATNYVQYGRDSVGDGSGTFQILGKLKPGRLSLISLDSTNFFFKANTAACVVEFLVLED